MKAIYLFIVLFLAWCIICARWYMFSVKGLSTDPLHFDPHETTTAIVEILFMVLVAFLLGFTIAWLLRDIGYKQNQSIIQELESERLMIYSIQQEQKDQIAKLEKELSRLRKEYVEASRENEKLKTELGDCTQDGNQWQRELALLEPKIKQYDSELSLLRFRIKQMEHQTLEKQEANQKLQVELEECKAQRRFERKEPVFSDFISDQILPGISQEEENEKDDLKKIAGIGPGIEKKLNDLGISTFKQISELTEVSSKRIYKAIKFFPGRIERDRWVEQASRLYLEKLRK
jgi:predicted flap endonuclease-1-like 5' DNA nuclease